MPPKQTAGQASSNSTKSSASPQTQNGNTKGKGPPDDELKKETSKMAQKSLAAENEAKDLAQAAAGAADADERQKLLETALRKAIEAAAFGKVAKWVSEAVRKGSWPAAVLELASVL